jgi:hypothetical protein
MQQEGDAGSSSTPARLVLREREAAAFLDISVKTLQSWRLRRQGPPYVKTGRAVRYRLCDLVRFQEANLVDHNAVRQSPPKPEANPQIAAGSGTGTVDAGGQKPMRSYRNRNGFRAARAKAAQISLRHMVSTRGIQSARPVRRPLRTETLAIRAPPKKLGASAPRAVRPTFLACAARRRKPSSASTDSRRGKPTSASICLW